MIGYTYYTATNGKGPSIGSASHEGFYEPFPEMKEMDPALAKEVSAIAQSRAIDDAILKGGSEIQEFYRDATVFVTGGTGFLGKQLIEKLFRSCDIKKVYLLMRPKRKKAFYERLNQMLMDPVFDAAKKLKPDFTKKIVPVQGDVAEKGLGISEEDRAQIVQDTEVIIHCAATINFDEPIKVATFTNVRGTVEILNLGKACSKLKSLIHVSTAYSHCTISRINGDVSEEFYAPPLSPGLMIDMCETMEEKRLKDITPDLIQNWPNTYSFTKAIAEEAVRLAGNDLPVCIVRPAIVIASNREPSPGWLDKSCLYGPTGLIVGSGVGLIHVQKLKHNVRLDTVPVDYVNNAIIAAGWECGTSGKDAEPKIYTVTNIRNHSKSHDLLSLMKNEVLETYPTPRMIYYPFILETPHQAVATILSWLLHFIPAYFIDLVLWVSGKKPMAVKLYTRAFKLLTLLSYFTTNEWRQNDQNLQSLSEKLNDADKVIYNFDVAKFDWDEQNMFWCLGARKYLIEDGLEGTAYAQKKLVWLRYLHYLVVCPLYALLLWKLATYAFTTLALILSFVCGLVY